MEENDWVAVVIEDDPDVRDLIDIVLTQSGFRTVVAEDGPSGVEAVRQHNPLLTTLDINMPGMDGFAVAKRLREFSNTYLIMITALADEIDVVQGFEAGADDYLVKPFRPRELRARADSMLRRPRTRQATPAHEMDADGFVDAPAPPAEPAATAGGAATVRALRPEAPEPAAPPPGPSAAPPVAQPPAPAFQPAPPVQPGQPGQPGQPAMPPGYVVPPAQAPAAWAPPTGAPGAPGYAAPYLHAVPSQPVPPEPIGPGGPSTDGTWVRFNGLELNNASRIVTVDGTQVELTRTEFDLLASLLSTGRRVRSKADLVLTMRGQQHVTSYFVNEADKRSVEVHIANLRRKIGDAISSPRFIETVRGVGYRLAGALRESV